MNIYSLLAIIIICLSFFYSDWKHTKQISKLLDRIMVRNYGEFKFYEQVKKENKVEKIEPKKSANEHGVKVDLSEFEEDWESSEELTEENEHAA
jgi:hypothetical protein